MTIKFGDLFNCVKSKWDIHGINPVYLFIYTNLLFSLLISYYSVEGMSSFHPSLMKQWTKLRFLTSNWSSEFETLHNYGNLQSGVFFFLFFFFSNFGNMLKFVV